MSEVRKKLSVLNPGDQGYEEAEEASSSHEMGLRPEYQPTVRLPEPTPPAYGGREARSLMKQHGIRQLKQGLHTHLLVNGAELHSRASLMMLMNLDQFYGAVNQLYQSRQRAQHHDGELKRACQLALGCYLQYFGVSMSELAEILARESGKPFDEIDETSGFWGWLIGD